MPVGMGSVDAYVMSQSSSYVSTVSFMVVGSSCFLLPENLLPKTTDADRSSSVTQHTTSGLTFSVPFLRPCSAC